FSKLAKLVTCVINLAEYRSEILRGRFRNANWCLPQAGRFSGAYGKKIVEDDEVQKGVFDDSQLRSEELN
ncbi:hypothetical protein N7519_009854, partial [Penicillium mononematosum]|uniref:uncharacterized protein n=1 Tax=Penicillium mononematosum TaxID=268346 RepID=UPI0025490BDA